MNTQKINRFHSQSPGDFKMKTKLLNPRLWLAALAALGLSLAACGEAEDINRVQPNYTKKDLFSGEWYARSVVVDKTFTNPFITIGNSGIKPFFKAGHR